jgi:hypothetical protein
VSSSSSSSSSFYRLSFFSIWLIIFGFLSTVGDSMLPSKYFWDSEILIGMMNGIVSSDVDDGSYYYTVKIFSFFGEGGLWILNSIVVLVFVSYCSLHSTNLKLFLIISFLVTPHIILGLLRPQKELIVTVITLIILGMYRFYNMQVRKVLLAILTLYLAYSIVRLYYLLIVLTFLYLYWLAYGVNRRKKLVSLLIIPVILIMPSSVIEAVQGTRDVFNALRPSGGAGHETIYFNPYPPINGFNFILNYFSALIHFNMPLLTSININTIFLQIYIFILLVVIYMHDWKLNRLVSIYLLLFFSHSIVLILFEPDSGSYLRHLSSVVVFLMPAIVEVFYERNS